LLVGPVVLHSLSANSYYVKMMTSTVPGVPVDFGNHDKDDTMDLFGLSIENNSHQCVSSTWEKFCCLAYDLSDHHDDKPLWWLLLRWMKMMLFKIARSYHVKPVLLMLSPLMVGLLVGYWLGQRSAQSLKRKGVPNDKIHKTWRGKFLGNVMETTAIAVKSCLSKLLLQMIDVIGLFWNNSSTGISNGRYNPCRVAPATTEPTLNNLVDFNDNPCNEKYLCVTKNKSIEKDTSQKEQEEACESTLSEREEYTRTKLKSERDTACESGVPPSQVPKHVAVIMDGNRRYGKAMYGNGSRGHWDGSSKLVEFAKWCLAEHVKVLTVFAFSSENWNRDPAEVASLMQIFAKYCDELRQEAIKKNIKIVVLSTDKEKVRQ
jgi:hypothetical protein